MTLKAKLTPNSLTLVFQQEIVIYKESMELNRTDVAMATPLPAALGPGCWRFMMEPQAILGE